MSSYRKTVEKLVEQGGDVPVYRLCTDCRESKNVAILSQYGGKCPGCFEAYCQQTRRGPVFGDVVFRDTPQQAAMRKRVRVA